MSLFIVSVLCLTDDCWGCVKFAFLCRDGVDEIVSYDYWDWRYWSGMHVVLPFMYGGVLREVCWVKV
ncbi:MAG: hypothetical protein NC344_03745 [Bacteroidales bacterium]|nr:hypothetical protein [Bacteroidales bacterium]MCM1146940.1 hypothetical protein [Bacteroidales bacterium]MCM1207013.1 hypothetical protein [Bacillota bacterium]MCM1511433.1 hypothetical protein [Clostridium sp.]